MLNIIFNLLIFYLLFIVIYRVALFLLQPSLWGNSMRGSQRKVHSRTRDKSRPDEDIIDADFEEIE